MSYEVPGFKFGTVTAAADLSTSQFCAVKVTAPNAVNISTAATDPSIGILQNKPAIGQPVEIMVDGVSKARTGGVVTAGDKVTNDATGRFITFTSGGAYAAGAHALGVALETSTAADQIIAVLLLPVIV